MKIFDNKKRVNRKGQLIVVNIMICVIVIITAIIFIEPLKQVLGIGITSLDCTNPSISTGVSMTCIGLDFLLPAFILICFGVGLAYIYNKNTP